MSYAVEKWLRKLINRVVELKEEVRYKSVSYVEYKLHRCDSMLKKIDETANQQGVNMFRYIRYERTIHKDLAEIRHILERRKESWWKRVLKHVVMTIDFVARIFGYDLQLTKRLSGGRRQIFLPPHNYD